MCKTREKTKRFSRAGMTLVEVIVSIAIFSMIMVASGRFIMDSLNSWSRTQTTIYSVTRINNVMMVMEKEVRQAQKPSPRLNGVNVYSDIEGTEPSEDGSRVDIFITDEHDEFKRVSYLVHDDGLWRMETDPAMPMSVDLDEAILVVPKVGKVKSSHGDTHPYYKMTEGSKQLMIRFEVLNTKGRLETLFEVNTGFTVRGQGVM